ncbi:MAG: gliding motility lipoprotein GldH [Bacteroidales bacterium]|nr:gliding motility lipoprotein GldH [Bacteroidales bacterium]
MKKFVEFVIIAEISALFSFGFAACNKGYVYDHYADISQDKGWEIHDTLVYDFEISDIMSPYTIQINIGYDNAYKYRNLFLFVDTRYPDSTTFRDTLQFMLSSPSGRLLGNGLSSVKEVRYVSAVPTVFKEAGNYSFRIIHGMRDEYIYGIDRVGVVIYK